jgi:hypothetical protein
MSTFQQNNVEEDPIQQVLLLAILGNLGLASEKIFD